MLPGSSALRLHLHKPRHGGFLVIENGIAVLGLVTVGSVKDASVACLLSTVIVAEASSGRVGQQ